MAIHLNCTIEEPSQIAAARRAAAQLAEHLGFSESDAGRVALVATELATNLLKHGGGGEILVRVAEAGAISGVELLAVDRGPGIANLGQSMRDGFSTAGSCGGGLGAIFRLAQQFDVYSSTGRGTAIVARLWPQPDLAGLSGGGHGAVCKPHPQESCCGDDWGLKRYSTGSVCLVADGLGHGPSARAAAAQAVDILLSHALCPPQEIVGRAHDALRSTRGAAVAVAQLDHERQQLRYCGVGNIAAAIVDENGHGRQLVSRNGTAGIGAPKIMEFTYPWTSSGLLIMHSDGLKQNWDLSAYPGLGRRDPSLIAGVLYRDFNRGNDDVTVLAVKS